MNAKKIYIYLGLLVLWHLPSHAQQRAIERIHITTDREVYVAGESIWLSLYCFDFSGQNPHFSELSSVAYLELRNGASLISTAKLLIDQGRGSGRISLSPSLPTGNYTLIAYTKQMLNEGELLFFEKVIPIINTLSTDRIPQNVIIQGDHRGDELNTLLKVESKHIEVKLGANGQRFSKTCLLPVSLINKSDETMTLSLSVFRADLPSVQDSSFHRFFLNNKPESSAVTFQNRYIPEYEGEIIRGRVTDFEKIQSKENLIFLSAVGSGVEVYSSYVHAETGDFTFFTNSLYGDREIVLEYPSAQEASFELFDPFVKPLIKPVPFFYLDKKYESSVLRRSVEMQVNRYFGLDTLYERHTIQNDPLVSNNKPVVYDLDHYTRFSIMQDIVVEFLSELRFRRNNNQFFLQVLFDSYFGLGTVNSLVLIDGIAIFDHERLMMYDPLKVKSVSIYQNDYYLGNNIFSGLVKFNTYTGKYPGLTLGKNSVILDYQGIQHPSRFTGSVFATHNNLPDIRSLLYWDPHVDIKKGESREITFQTSSVPGKYVIVLEGVTIGGQPVYVRSEFFVE